MSVYAGSCSESVLVYSRLHYLVDMFCVHCSCLGLSCCCVIAMSKFEMTFTANEVTKYYRAGGLHMTVTMMWQLFIGVTLKFCIENQETIIHFQLSLTQHSLYNITFCFDYTQDNKHALHVVKNQCCVWL